MRHDYLIDTKFPSHPHSRASKWPEPQVCGEWPKPVAVLRNRGRPHLNDVAATDWGTAERDAGAQPRDAHQRRGTVLWRPSTSSLLSVRNLSHTRVMSLGG